MLVRTVIAESGKNLKQTQAADKEGARTGSPIEMSGLIRVNVRFESSVRPIVLSLIAFVSFGLAQENPGEFFEMRVRPVPAKHCYSCHSSGNAMGGLALNTREALLKGGKSGPSIQAGNAEGSLLLQAVSAKKIAGNLTHVPGLVGL